MGRISVKPSMKPYARKLPLHHMEPQLHLPTVPHHQSHHMDSPLVKENMAHPKLLQKDMELQLLQNVHNRKSKSAQRSQDNNANKSPNKKLKKNAKMFPSKLRNKNVDKFPNKNANKYPNKYQKQSMKIAVSRYQNRLPDKNALKYPERSVKT